MQLVLCAQLYQSVSSQNCSDWTLSTDSTLGCRCHTAHYCSVHCLEKDTKAHNSSGECLLMQANQSRYKRKQNLQCCIAPSAPLPVSQNQHVPTNLPESHPTQPLQLATTRQQVLADRYTLLKLLCSKLLHNFTASLLHLH